MPVLFTEEHRLTGYRDLREALVKAVNGGQVILHGELVVTDHLGRRNFGAMRARRNQVRFFAFDLLHLNGEDLRAVPLVKRKERLKAFCRLDHRMCFMWTTREAVGRSYSASAASLTWKAL